MNCLRHCTATAMTNTPPARLRRLRMTPGVRALFTETRLTIDNLVYPLFIVEGTGVRREISSMPGVFNLSLDQLETEARELADLGIRAVLLFGIPNTKDEHATGAYAENGIVQRAIQTIKRVAPSLFIISDVCLCEYTLHGHCGLLEGGRILNDPTVELLAQTAVSHACAGADMIAPSDMMDLRIGEIRKALDSADFLDTPIMSYSTKYASSFYGPFREAAQSTPAFGDRKSHQLNPTNLREALREAAADVAEGADALMVKPATCYLDILRELRNRYDLPLAAYHVSGEYAMIKAAAERGWIDEARAAWETLISIRRAGADIVITYFAKDLASGKLNYEY
jgi:porphobilinogen synthase